MSTSVLSVEQTIMFMDIFKQCVLQQTDSLLETKIWLVFQIIRVQFLSFILDRHWRPVSVCFSVQCDQWFLTHSDSPVTRVSESSDWPWHRHWQWLSEYSPEVYAAGTSYWVCFDGSVISSVIHFMVLILTNSIQNSTSQPFCSSAWPPNSLVKLHFTL